MTEMRLARLKGERLIVDGQYEQPAMEGHSTSLQKLLIVIKSDYGKGNIFRGY